MPELNPETRIAGVLAPIFTLRRADDAGIGDTRALIEFIDWAAAHGFSLVKLLPVNETGPDNSPYNAISAVALDPILLDTSPGALPDLTDVDLREVLAAQLPEAAPETAPDAEPVISTAPVNYPRVRRLKLCLLEAAFARFENTQLEAGAFEAFCKGNAGWLDDYVLFRSLMVENGGSEMWTRWPGAHQSVAAARAWLAALTEAERARMARRMRFYQYVQWQAARQWSEVKRHADARGVALMGDIPYGVSYFSADVWAQRDLFRMDWSGGTPPDHMFESDAFVVKWGQNWGIPLYNWDAMRADGLTWWKRRVGMARQYFDLLRIDHVLGFYRFYGFPWRPERNDEFLPLSLEEAGARTAGILPRYHPAGDENHDDAIRNRDTGTALLEELAREAGPYHLIGEDLGVVPWYVRDSLAQVGLAGYRIPQWEHKDGHAVPGSDYARLSLTTYGTHDHETLRELWERCCAHPEGQDMRSLAEFTSLSAEPRPFTPEIHEAMLRALFASNAWIAVLQLADVFGWADRINLPGTTSDANWTRRVRMPLGEAEGEGLAARMRDLIAASGRAVPP
jgi:4-alpha-glucanotransferase